MADYIGKTCIICGEKFTKDDDIVVCPECGTPYHRECYNKIGHCINTKLHEENKSWKSENDKKEEEASDKIKCSVCGTMNPKSGLFCEKCGNPLHTQNQGGFQGSSSRPNMGIPPVNNINDMIKNMQKQIPEDSEIDGIKVKDYNKFIGSNNLYYVMQFLNFSKLKSKISMNLSAFLVPELYFLNRKMFSVGIPVLIFNLLSYIPMLIGLFTTGAATDSLYNNISFLGMSGNNLETFIYILNIIYLGIRMLLLLFANYLYFRKCKKDISHINSLDISQTEKEADLASKGGTSVPCMLIVPIVYVVLAILVKLLF